MAKKYDMVVKTGTYQLNGKENARWLTIGAVMDDGKGGLYAFVNRSFNPAGIPFKEGSESIMVSFFEPKTKGQDSNNAPQPEQTLPVAEDSTEIPF